MSVLPTITVLYTCKPCGLNDVPVQVRARLKEGVVEWLEEVLAHEVARDHFRRSPHCLVGKMDCVKIPMAGRSMVGGLCEN